MSIKRKLAFFCGPDKKFLPDITGHFSNKTDEYEVRIFNSRNVKDFTDMLEWSDISWFEWCDSLVVEASKLPKACKMVCRLHRYEAFTRFPSHVNWDNIDTLILVANHIKDALKMQIPDIEDKVNIRVVYNGVNMKRFAYKERSKGFDIAYIGYINYRKNPGILLQCMKALVDKDPRYVLHIAGTYQDEDCKLYIEQMLDELNLRDNIKFYGWINNLETWTDDMQFLISTSIHEGHPCGIMEGMATGLKPLVHNFYAAEEMYPRKYLFNTIEEFVNMVMDNEFDSAEYRKFIGDNYPLERQLNDIESVFNELS